MARSTLTLATLNLENLRLPGRAIYGAADGPSESDYEAKVAALGALLARTDAQVVGFQEVWDVAALEAVMEEAGLAGSHQIVARPAPSGFEPQVALACARGMLTGEARWHADFPEGFRLRKRGGADSTLQISVGIDNFSRPVLHARLTPPSPKRPSRGTVRPVDVFVAHLKSKRPTDLDRADRHAISDRAQEDAIGSALSTIRRAAEAAALRWLVVETARGDRDPVVVLGDLNDGSLATTTVSITGEPSYKLFVSSRVGRTETKSGDVGLYSVQMLQELRSHRNVYYTHVYRNRMESLDHILVSEEFYDHSPRRAWAFKEMRVFNDYLAYDGKNDARPTDHALVEAAFLWDPLPERMDEALVAAPADTVGGREAPET